VLQEWGYVAIVVDSFGPREIEQTCTDFFRINNAQRALDAYAALRHLTNQPFVEPNRVGVMGGSAGGITVLDTVQEGGVQTALDLSHGGFKVAIAWYPYCPPLGPFDTPLLILAGEKDTLTPAALCVEMTSFIRGQGAPITLNVYPGATHAFDVPAEELSSTFGHVMAYHDQATAEAKADLKQFLDQHLKGPASADQAANKRKKPERGRVRYVALRSCAMFR
jgi:dienelactone hydrolase